MKNFVALACGVVVLLAGGSVARGQAALERLEKKLQKPGKPAPPKAVRPAPLADDEKPAPRDAAQPGYLGAITDDRDDPGRGVRIVEAVEDGPAAEAGLREDDLIVGVNGRPVRKMADLAKVIERSPPGTELSFDIERDGEKHRVTVTLGERPAAAERRAPEFGRIPDDSQPGAPATRRPVGPAPEDLFEPALPGPRASNPRQVDRMQLLEQRIEELERRVQQLEAALREKQ